MEIHRDKKLNSLIGKVVEVVLFDDKIIKGILGYTAEFSEKYKYRKPGYYTCGIYDFKKSHVKKIRGL